MISDGADDLPEYLRSELCTAAIRAGADPDAVTADLVERLRRVELMVASIAAETAG